jgi:Ser/Thr protein kinase RdoA (MazF antagonist)
MRRLAETALTVYDLGDVRLTPLMHFFNTTFRVDAFSQTQETNRNDQTACKRGRYVIRIHRPGSQDTSTIQSELLWLLALRHEAGLVVPEPVPTREGALVTSASTAGVPEARQCVLFRWVYGRFLRERLAPKEMERVGAFMARLHLHAKQFVVPEGFFRKRWDYEGIRSVMLGTDLERSWAYLSRDDRMILDAVSEKVQQAMNVLGEGREVFGLIHADFYERNYLFAKGEVHAIDFDGCGWGYYLFDIGVAFSTLIERDNYLALRQAFLKGYRQVQPLSADNEAAIDTFIAARLMGHILWLAAHVNEPSYGLRSMRRIEMELGALKRFLAHNQFSPKFYV